MVNEGGCSLDRGHRYGKNARCLPLRWIYQPLERRRAEGAGISTKSSSEFSRNAIFFFLRTLAETLREYIALVGRRSSLRLREISKLRNRISKRGKWDLWLERDKWQCRVFGKMSQTRY